MLTGILTFEQWQGKKELGSSRIRGHWIVKNWNKKTSVFDVGDAEIYMLGRQYDCVIYQKAYFVEHAKLFKGIKILDICDPDWLNWSYRFKEMLEEVDAVTCSSMELCKSIEKFTQKPVYFVPDRVDLESMPSPKIHTGPTKKISWYGYSHNFPILDSCIKALSDMKLELIVIADGVYAQPSAFSIPVTNYPFSPHYLDDIKRGDVVINPKYTKGKWRFKSENKTFIARSIGMPVAHDAEELKQMLTEEQRVDLSKRYLMIAKEEYDISSSVEDYKMIINDIKIKKNV